MPAPLARVTSRRARRLTVHVPVSEATLAALLGGDRTAMDRDPVLAAMLQIIRDEPALGDFRVYNGVAEIMLGWETFAPTFAAKPTLGKAGEVQHSATVTLTTWIRDTATDAMVEAAYLALVQAHPWEVPVIEVTETRLLLRPEV